jgi:hypothetical protein
MSFEDRNNIIFNTEYYDFNSYYNNIHYYNKYLNDCDCNFDCECENIEFESRNIIIMENEKSDMLDLDNLIIDFNNMHI